MSMTRIEGIRTETYELRDGFYMDIVARPEARWEAWIYKDYTGEKVMVTGGSPRTDFMNIDQFRNHVKYRVDEYIDYYKRYC